MILESRAKSIGISAAACVLAGMGAASTAEAAVVISAGATNNIACVGGVCTPTEEKAILNVTQLQSLLASGNVQVTTAGPLATNIVVMTGFSWVSAHNLTLDAYRSITVDGPVAVDGSGGLSLVTDDGGSRGKLTFGPKGSIKFLATSNSLTINGTAYTLVNNIATLASDIAANSSGDFALADNYDAKNDGTYSQSAIPTTFTGTLEGLGNTISHLSVENGPASPREFIGMFSLLDEGSVVADLHLTNVFVRGSKQNQLYVGALAGESNGELTGDSVSGTVDAQPESSAVGGLVCISNGTISNSWSTANVNGYATVAGGLVADNQGPIDNSYATGHVNGKGDVGGLVGSNDAAIDDSYATGAVTSNGGYDTSYAGGLVGTNAGPIGNSYSTGAVAGVIAGGLLGSDNASLISDSYSTGSVKGGEGGEVYSGGLVGYYSSGTLMDSDWDATTSGITNLGKGCGNASCPGATGLSTTQLQAGLPAGFSPAIWGESPSINGGLPYLLALPPK